MAFDHRHTVSVILVGLLTRTLLCQSVDNVVLVVESKLQHLEKVSFFTCFSHSEKYWSDFKDMVDLTRTAVETSRTVHAHAMEA